MGFSTGADKMLPPAGRPQQTRPRPKTGSRGPGSLGFWGVMGAGAISVLAWLMVDLGGPKQMVTALYSVNAPSPDWASLRQEVRRLAAQRPAGASGQSEEVTTLKRQVALLEGMLAGRRGNLAAYSGIKPDGSPDRSLGAPRTTASLPEKSSALPIAERFAPLTEKVDLPAKSVKGTTRPPTHISSQVAPVKMALATNSAKRSRLAPDPVFGLDLGAYQSIEQLAQRWRLIRSNNGDVLGDLIPRRFAEFSADGRVVHRLIATPLADAVDVARRCASLQARLVPCRQIIGAGEPL